TADGNGNWTFEPASALAEGKHSFSTVVKNPNNGSQSDASAAIGFTVDTTPPDAPVITSLYDNVGDTQGYVANGGVTDDQKPVLSGTAEAGSTVKISGKLGSAEFFTGTVIADSNGHWSLEVNVGYYALSSEATYTFTATATDSAGNTSTSSNTWTVTSAADTSTDTTPPDAPVISNYHDDAGSVTGTFGSGTTTDDVTPTLMGKAEAGSIVKIYDGNTLIGSVTAGSNGSWTFNTPALSEGSHAFTATATDTAGNTSGKSAGFVVNVDLPDPGPGTATITSVYDDVGPSTGYVANGGTTDDASVLITGKATANSKVYVYDNGAGFTTVYANSQGVWSTTVPSRNDGQHVFTAREVSASGTEGPDSNSWLVYVQTADTTPPGAPTITNATDNVGDMQGDELYNNGTTDDTTPELHGKAEANSVVRIYDGGILLGSTTANSSGSWSYTPPARSEGAHVFTATATDAAGNTSGKSAGFVVNIDTLPQYSEYAVADMLQSDKVINNSYKGDGFTITSTGQITHFEGDAASFRGIALANANPTSSLDINLSDPATYIGFYISGLGNLDGGSRIVIFDTNGIAIYDGKLKNPGNTHGDFFTYTAPENTTIGRCRVYGDNADGGITINNLKYIARHPFDINTDVEGETSAYVSDALQSDLNNMQYFGENFIAKTNGVIKHYDGDAYSFSGLSLASNNTSAYITYDFKKPIDEVSIRISGLNSTSGSRVIITGTNGEILFDQYVHADGSSGTKYGAYHFFNYHAPEGHEIATMTVWEDGVGGITMDELSFKYHYENVSSLNLLNESLISTTHEINTTDSTVHYDVEHEAVINTHGGSSNVLSLELNDILDHAYDNLFIHDNKQQLAIIGDKGDVVELKVEDFAHNEWLDVGKATAGGIQYEVYQHSGLNVELLVQEGVELHQVS
ncbi:Ig-like domain-containing protein, partial [Klebsiella aerogenes]